MIGHHRFVCLTAGLVLMAGAGCSTSTGTASSDSTSAASGPTISVAMAEASPGTESAVGGAVDGDEPTDGDQAAEGEGDGSAGGLGQGRVIVANVEVPSIKAFAAPDADSTEITELANPTAIGGPLVFQAVSSDFEADAEWLEVRLPVRPNGTTGWVRRAEVTIASNPYRIEIDVADHNLQVFRDDEVWLETSVAIGTGATPTPIGEFYVIELLQPPDPNGPYGSYAFGLSGFSETLTEFAGGEGVIGIHGTNDPASLGSDVSHGCVRMANDVISELAGVLPLGTPVIISA